VNLFINKYLPIKVIISTPKVPQLQTYSCNRIHTYAYDTVTFPDRSPARPIHAKAGHINRNPIIIIYLSYPLSLSTSTIDSLIPYNLQHINCIINILQRERNFDVLVSQHQIDSRSYKLEIYFQITV
jgi:hypothetical protein